MLRPWLFLLRPIVLLLALAAVVQLAPARAADVEGSSDHPAISRYPGSEIAWFEIENYMPYRVAVGPETGYRSIGEWIDTEGRITRLYYRLAGDKSHQEVWKNYRDALEAAGFEILLEGLDPKKSTDPAGRSWTGTFLGANPWTSTGAVREMVSGSSSSGGRGVVIARKERAEGTLYVVVNVYRFRDDQVSTLIDVIEERPAETGLVIANAEAIGRDIEEYGRVVLEGLMFDHDTATLTSESKAALEEIAKFLAARPELGFYVVGHTDATGSFDYNRRLSAERAAAVAEALATDYGIARERLEPHGVGPLNPVFANASDAGRAKNRRVELVER